MVVRIFYTYRVLEWDSWAASMKRLAEDDPQAAELRDKHGLLNRWVYRSVDDPNEVMLIAEYRSRQDAESFLRDPDRLRRWHERTGLEVFPPVLIMEEFEGGRFSRRRDAHATETPTAG